LAVQSSHPIYDFLYLALALDRRTHVVTDDRRFAAAAARLGLRDNVQLLGR
jgi:predicted nucleic acid-binding protein